MKFIILLSLAVIAAGFLGPFVPFWGLMIILAFCPAIVGGRVIKAILATGLGVGSVWLALPLWITITTGSELPGRIAGIIGFESPFLLVLITGMVGFIIGAMSAWCGISFRKLFYNKKSQGSPYYK